MSTILQCATCREVFRVQSALNNHVKRVHQIVVKVRFQSGEIKEIIKGKDDVFTCGCGRVFQYPQSILRHGRRCKGFEQDDNRGINIKLSQSGDFVDEMEVTESENLGDCIGI